MIVCKFGGTSVADAPAIRRLVEIVRGRAPERPLVVVSALAGVTNDLLRLAGPLAAGNEAGLRTAMETLVARHTATARELNLPQQTSEEFAASSDQLLSVLTARLGAKPGAELLDTIAAPGELWSSRLVAAALARAGVRSACVDVRQVMRTDTRFGRAAPDSAALADQAPGVFGPLLADGTVPVTQGFIGATPDGRTTTLGRGGSDYTAALLGAALRAERVEIWTDVDGIMTADPRIVPEARVLPVASHLEAAELATFGARVLHPATQAPLVQARIPCVVLNSFAADRPGTTILAGVRPDPVGSSPVRSISWKKGVTILNVRAPRMLGAHGFLRSLFEVFERHAVAVDVVATSEINVSLTIEDAGRLPALRADLEALGEVSVFERRAIVAVVGIGLRGTRGLAARIFSAIKSVNVEMISQGASEINVTFVVTEEDGPAAVRLLHDEFFGREAA